MGLKEEAVEGDSVKFSLDVFDVSFLSCYLEFFITGNWAIIDIEYSEYTYYHLI